MLIRRGTKTNGTAVCLTACSAMLSLAGPMLASSHREAPFITENPKVDGTDFYFFRAFEEGRGDFLVVVANYIPLQAPYGGPNYFTMDPNARYEIHFDNNGDAVQDKTFRFQFTTTLKDFALDVGGVMVSVPLINIGGIGPDAGDTDNLNVTESYTVNMVTTGGPGTPLTNADTADSTFAKPVDNIGNKSLSDYAAYAASHIYNINIPGCDTPGRMFVGQRKDPFVVNLGEVFDLVNTNPVGPVDGELDLLADANVTSLILELPISCVTNGAESTVGAWMTASLHRTRILTNNPSFDKPTTEVGSYIQVSRLANPLVNEVVIGIKDKDKFNASKPMDDGQFLTYVTNPTLPVLLNVLFGVTPPCLTRDDLVAVFLTGVSGLNQPANVVASEMMRLNTAIAATPAGSQSNLGVIGGDVAGYPNGRRPGDDVVDISLRAVMGILYPDAGDPDGCAPSALLPYTDGAYVSDAFFGSTFPYLNDPLPGSPSN